MVRKISNFLQASFSLYECYSATRIYESAVY